MQFRLRDATNADLPRIVAIERRAFAHPWAEEAFHRELTLSFSRIVLGVTDQNDLGGYLCRWLIADECHILNVAVDTKYRRQGLGELLMREAIAEAVAKRVAIVTLEVRRSNTAARCLYRKLAFEERRLRKNYYGQGEDAIVMERRLTLTTKNRTSF
ncbi:MAG TPA: ribosomal protein S18-alanine N-acetyltransferase [Candidatus Binataceae bacterium]|nr:ribosomal protein S18-alanine N-acetyltransferase [Candidatus Binataceae bacterium]